MKLNCKRLTDSAKLPNKDRPEDEGWDIFADETVVLKEGRVTKVSTGIACAVEDETKRVKVVDLGDDGEPDESSLRTEPVIDKQYWLQIEGRSGLAFKGIFPVGGVVDNGYTGDIGVMLANMSGEGYSINKGDKIAQLVIRKHYDPELVEVNTLGTSDRGDKGFGSSGK